MALQMRRLCHALGAEIIGVDFRQPIDDQTFSQIYAAFLEYSVLRRPVNVSKAAL